MTTKHLVVLTLSVVLIGTLAGCAAKQAETPEPEQAETASTGSDMGTQRAGPTNPAPGDWPGFPPDGAFGGINQLALGTLYLQETEYPVTAEQASVLLPYWNQVKTLQESEGADPEQYDDLLSEINEAMTAEQASLLANLSQEDLFAWAQNEGLMAGFGPRGNAGEGVPQLSEEERATAQAAHAQGQTPQPPRGPQGRFPTPFMIDAVITMLEALING